MNWLREGLEIVVKSEEIKEVEKSGGVVIGQSPKFVEEGD